MQSEKEGQSKSEIIVVDFGLPGSSTWVTCLGTQLMGLHFRHVFGWVIGQIIVITVSGWVVVVII
jgi:uncharacterized membrane protein